MASDSDNTQKWDLRRHVSKSASIPSVEGKIKLEVSGNGIDRPTWIYIYRHQLEAKVEKYRKRRQYLIEVD